MLHLLSRLTSISLAEGPSDRGGHVSPTLLKLPTAFFPSIGPSITASRKLIEDSPVLLDFSSGWNVDSSARTWYDKECQHGSTAIAKLQFRKDRAGPWFHGYIVLFTVAGRIYRIDRRPDLQGDRESDTMAFMRAGGCRALDTVVFQTSLDYEVVERSSECILELNFSHSGRRQQGVNRVYLLHILSACFSVRDDPSTRQYTLQRYNCYYLAWVIIMISVRLVSDWETRSLLALSASPEFHDQSDHDDSRSMHTSSSTGGKFYTRESWQQQLVQGWQAFYVNMVNQQGMVEHDAAWTRRRQRICSMLQHAFQRVLLTEPVTYPSLWLHPRNVLHELGMSIAENMPSAFNSNIAKFARNPQNLADGNQLNQLSVEVKAHLRIALTDDRLLDPASLILFPGEFTAWLINTPPTHEDPSLPLRLRITSVKHAFYRDYSVTLEEPFSYGDIYSEISSHCFDLPVIEGESEIYLLNPTTQDMDLCTPIQLEAYMRQSVASHANRVTAWGLARRTETVEEDIMMSMEQVWEKVLKEFPKALSERWM